MATAVNSENERPFSVGEVMSRAIAVMRANPVPIFGIAFLFGALPQQLFQYFSASLVAVDSATRTAGVAVGIASILFAMFLASLVAGAIVHITVGFAQGERMGFGESVSAGLVKAIPLLGLSILMAIGLFFGLMFLVVPGVILMVLWSVASPALVAEDIGVIEAFGRSRHLTKGARWRVFGLGVLMVVILWIVSALVGIALVVSNGTGALVTASIPLMIFSALVGTLSSAFTGAVQTNLYLALRDWKDGPGSGTLAEVFA